MEIFRLNAEIEKLKNSIDIFKDKINNLSFSAARWKDDNKNFHFYTGLPSYGHFEALLEYLDPGAEGENVKQCYYHSKTTGLKSGCIHKLSVEDELFSVLIRLKLGVVKGIFHIVFQFPYQPSQGYTHHGLPVCI